MDLSLSYAIACSLVGAASGAGAFMSLTNFRVKKLENDSENYIDRIEAYKDKVEKKIELIANDVSAMKASQELLIKLLNSQLK